VRNTPRPPFPYHGGKQKLAEQIISLLPTHEHYVEPYAGSLSVLLAKRPSPVETVNDLDDALMTFWRVLRDRHEDLERVAALTPHARGELELVRGQLVMEGDDLETARRVLVRLTQGRGSTLGDPNSGWRYAAKPDYGSASAHLGGYCDRIPPCARRIRHVSLERRPALEIVADYGRHPGVLLYVDPPYVLGTRSKPAGRYRFEMTDDDHRALAGALRSAAATVVLSGYPSDLYDVELYPDWHRIELASSTSNGGQASERTEVLWSNRQLERPHDLFALALSDTRPYPREPS
jgi:DNA adenine methylase